ncbi:MAG: hypothetical protein WCG45_06195, partial [bacterium]
MDNAIEYLRTYTANLRFGTINVVRDIVVDGYEVYSKTGHRILKNKTDTHVPNFSSLEELHELENVYSGNNFQYIRLLETPCSVEDIAKDKRPIFDSVRDNENAIKNILFARETQVISYGSQFSGDANLLDTKESVGFSWENFIDFDLEKIMLNIPIPDEKNTKPIPIPLVSRRIYEKRKNVINNIGSEKDLEVIGNRIKTFWADYKNLPDPDEFTKIEYALKLKKLIDIQSKYKTQIIKYSDKETNLTGDVICGIVKGPNGVTGPGRVYKHEPQHFTKWFICSQAFQYLVQLLQQWDINKPRNDNEFDKICSSNTLSTNTYLKYNLFKKDLYNRIDNFDTPEITNNFMEKNIPCEEDRMQVANYIHEQYMLYKTSSEVLSRDDHISFNLLEHKYEHIIEKYNDIIEKYKEFESDIED